VFDSNLTGNGTFTVSADPGELASGAINPGQCRRGGSGVIDPGFGIGQSC